MKRAKGAILWAGVLLASLALTLADWGHPREARASVDIAVTYDALLRSSSAVVVATAIDQRSVWEGGRIFTYTEVHVDSSVAGELAEDERAWVRTMGGIVGKVGQVVDGEPGFTVGRPSLVFLHPISGQAKGDSHAVFLVTARAQGQFGLYADEKSQVRVARSHALGALVPPAGSSDPSHPSQGELAGDVLHGRAIADVTRDIATAWSRVHTPSHAP